MALSRLPYKALAPLVRDYLRDQEAEDEHTAALLRELRDARERGYLTPSELESICRWKSPRALQLIRSNSAARVRSATRRALGTRSELKRLDALCELQGVSVPMASAILMFVNPKRYGVIDIRVWQILHALGTVRKNADGIGFSFKNWYQYLMILRSESRRFKVPARDVERAIFTAHHDHYSGLLYRNGAPRS